VDLSRVIGVGLALVMLLASIGCSARSGSAGRGGGVEDSEGIGDEGLASEPSIDQFERSGAVTPGGIYTDVVFAFDSDQLDAAAERAVAHNAEVLGADSSRRVEIEGHCDERGASEYNLALGARRARAVRDALVGMGIASDRLSTVSYGEELPLCKESNESCWSQNRRVHLVDLGR
jgi:peptidoglycan-associated lipoprotein